MNIDAFFRPLTGAIALRPAVFVGRMARLQPGRVFTAAVVVTLLGVTEGLGLSLLLPLLALIGVDTGTGSSAPARVIEQVLRNLGIPIALVPILGVFFALGVLQVVLTAVQQYLIVSSGERITVMLRQRLFDAASRAAWPVLAAGRGGHLINAIVGESGRIGIIFGNSVTVFGLFASFAVYVAFAAWLSWQVTAVIAVLALLSMIGLRSVYGSSRRFGAYTSKATNRMQEILSEHVLAAKLIRSFGAGAWSRETFGAAVQSVGDYLRRNHLNTVLVKSSVEPFGLLVIVGLVYVSVTVLRQPAAELMLLLLIFYRLTPRLVQLQEMLQRIHGVLPAYESASETLRKLIDAEEPSGTRAAPPLTSGIELRGIEVRHQDSVVLSDLNLTIPARSTVALIGPSGGGKTTLLDVLAGVVQPSRGDIIVDGVRFTDLDINSYRRKLAVVPQDSFLFHDTIATNLRFSAPAATDEELWDALRLAHAEEFVRASDKGLQTIVGDQGLRMSGGQRQRISLARALLRRPEILLLDEPSSALDAETEEVLRGTFRRLRGEMTIVIVSHRASLAEDADRAYLITNGSAELVTAGASVRS